MKDTRLYLLGPVQLQQDSRPILLKIAKMQALLAYLAITGTPQPRDHLLGLLWAESHPQAARKNLRNSLWRLRQELGEDVLVAEGELLAVSQAVWTDVSAFEERLTQTLASEEPAPSDIQQAVALWRGPLLAGIRLSEAPEFELWLEAERTRLGHLYRRGLERLLTTYRDQSRWGQVITVAQQLLDFDPTAEAAHAALMTAYAVRGERSQALRQYDTLRTTLNRELGTRPTAESKALHAQILRGDFAQAPVVQPTRSLPARSLPGKKERPPQPFVGRQAEQDQLTEALATATTGRLQIVLLTGELGIGKTYLWHHWAAGLSSATIVLEARCLDTTQPLPFAPITSLLRSPGVLDSILNQGDSISTVWLTELARLLPEIRMQRPDLPEAATVPPEEETRRLFEAFVQALQAMSAVPLVLFLDDLHWTDHATMDWLVYLVDRMRDEPLLLVVTYRDAETPNALLHQVSAWQRQRLVRHLPLLPLSLPESTELLLRMGRDIDRVDYFHTHSGGNPYYLTELSRAFPESPPAALADLVRARLADLPESVQSLLRAAAVLEPTIDFRMLQFVAQLTEEETLDGLDQLLDRALLIEQGERYGFAHPLLAEVVRTGFSAPRRRRLHQQVVEGLLANHGDELNAIAGQLTRHYAAIGDQQEAARFADIAADQAVLVAAMAEATSFRRRAYQLVPTPARLLALGHALIHVPGALQEARDALQQALHEFDTLQDQVGMAQAGLGLAVSYLSTEEGEKVLDWAERLQARLGHIEDVEVQATIQYLMGAGKARSAHAIAEAEHHFQRATHLATEHSLHSDVAIQCWFAWGNLSVQFGDLVQAQSMFEQTLALAQSVGNIYFQALAYNNLAYAFLLAGDVPASRRTIDTGLAFIERNELLRPRQYLYSTHGEIALAEGNLDTAERWLAAAIQEAELYENATHVINIQAHQGRLSQARGDFQQAEERLLAAHRAIPRSSAQHLQIQIDLWLAELYLAGRALPKAEAALKSARALLQGSRRMALQRELDRLQTVLTNTPESMDPKDPQEQKNW